MIARCPACGARTPGRETCRRCGCLLHGLAALLDAARAAERRAVAALLNGEMEEARTQAELAQGLDGRGLGAVLTGFLAWRKQRKAFVRPTPHWEGASPFPDPSH